MKTADKEEMLKVLDDNGNETGVEKLRSVVHKQKLWHNEVACVVVNNKKQVLLQKRSKNKKSYPRCWALCAGHVVGSMTIRDAAIQEVKEELGIEPVNMFLLVPKMKNVREDNYCFATCFCCCIDKPLESFTRQEEEVDELKWFSIDEFKNMIKSEKGCIFKNNEYYRKILTSLEDFWRNDGIKKE